MCANLKHHKRVYILSSKHTCRPMRARVVAQLFHKLEWVLFSPGHITFRYTKCKSLLLLMLFLFVSLFLVSCSICEAVSSRSDDQKLLFYVFGSEAIYVIDPESKTVLSKIKAEVVCTKSNNRYSR